MSSSTKKFGKLLPRAPKALHTETSVLFDTTPTSTRLRPDRATFHQFSDECPVDDERKDASYIQPSNQGCDSDSDSDSDSGSTNKHDPFSIPKLTFVSLTKVAEVALRFDNSAENVAQIISAFLEDVANDAGVKLDQVITADKVRAAIEHVRKSSVRGISGKKVYGIFADCKEDKCTATYNKDAKRREIVKEGHCTIVLYTGTDMEKAEELYVGWSVPRPVATAPLKAKKIKKNEKKKKKNEIDEDSVTGRVLAAEIINYLEKLGLDLSDVRVVGADGTTVNTGVHKGFMTEIQHMVGGRLLQWSVCLLHQTELTLRALWDLVDEPVVGPESYPGDIGKRISSEDVVWGFAVRDDFEPVPVHFPLLDEEVLRGMNKDARYLHRLCHYLTKDPKEFPPGLAKESIGALHSARWLNLAARICRLYVTLRKDDPVYRDTKRLVMFVVAVYFKVYSAIKLQPNIEDGAVHLLNQLQLTKKFLSLSKDRRAVQKSISINSFFGHPTNVLLAMLAHESEEIRSQAIELIKEVRKFPDGELKFYKPMINTDAGTLLELCPMVKTSLEYPGRWTYVSHLGEVKLVQEPPMVRGLDLDSFKTQRFRSTVPCHTQAVERHVQVTSSSVGRVTDHMRQVGGALAKTRHRKAYPGPVRVAKRLRIANEQ